MIVSALITTSPCSAVNEFFNGKNCHLESELTCHIGAANGPACETMGMFDLGKCNIPHLRTSFNAVYVVSYENKNQKGNPIRFRTETNPDSDIGNPFSFLDANTLRENIELDQILNPGVKKNFEVRRVIDPCGERGQIPTERFVSELQLNGYVVGKKDVLNFSCSTRNFFDHRIVPVTPPPTPAPTYRPTVRTPIEVIPAPTPAPTQYPTPVPTGKGKGYIRHNKNI